jgi:hypothetical protein
MTFEQLMALYMDPRQLAGAGAVGAPIYASTGEGGGSYIAGYEPVPEGTRQTNFNIDAQGNWLRDGGPNDRQVSYDPSTGQFRVSQGTMDTGGIQRYLVDRSGTQDLGFEKAGWLDNPGNFRMLGRGLVGAAALGGLGLEYLPGLMGGTGVTLESALAALPATEGMTLAEAGSSLLANGAPAAAGTGAAATAAGTAGAAASGSGALSTLWEAIQSGGSQFIQPLLRALGGNGQGAGANGADLAKLAFLAQQWREANGQAKDLQGQAKRDMDFQRGVIQNVGNYGAAALDRASAAANAADANRFNISGQIGQQAGQSQSDFRSQLARAGITDARGGLIDSLQSLGDAREMERRDSFQKMQGSIGSAEGKLSSLYDSLGPRRMFTEGDVNKASERIYGQRVGEVDRAMKIASSQGFADAMRNGVERSTQGELSRDGLVRRFSDVYSKLDADSRDAAMKEVTGLSGLQTNDRTGAISDLTSTINPTMAARIQAYRPDDTAVNAKTAGANYGIADRGQQMTFASQLGQLSNQLSSLWNQSGQQTQHLTQDQIRTLFSAGADLSRTGMAGANSLADSSTRLAAAGTTAAGTARSRMFDAGVRNFGGALTNAANSAGSALSEWLNGPTKKPSTNPFGNMDTNDYSRVDENLYPGTL